MSHIFISYSHKDKAFARDQLKIELESRDFDCWIDVEDIPPTAEWQREIYKNIEKSIAVVFVISPNSIGSQPCKNEIAYAIKIGKRIIPIVYHEINSKDVPEEIKKINDIQWIFFRDGQDDFSVSHEKLVKAITTDLIWVEFHTTLLQKALEWERNDYENGYLLHSKELADSEKIFIANLGKEPSPIEPQSQFISKSRIAENLQIVERRKTNNRLRNRAITIGGIAILAVIAICLAMMFGGQVGISAIRAQNANSTAKAEATRAEQEANAHATSQVIAGTQQVIADQETKTNNSIELANQAVDLRDDPAVSLLLSLEAFYLNDNSNTRTTLWQSSVAYPDIYQIYGGHYKLAFSPNGRILASISAKDDFNNDEIVLRNVETGNIIQVLKGNTEGIFSLAFSPDGKILASGKFGGDIVFWDIATSKQINTLHGHSDLVVSLAFSPDGKRLASGSYDGKAILWNLENNQILYSFVEDFATEGVSITNVVFNSSGNRLLFASGLGYIYLMDTNNGAMVTRIDTGGNVAKVIYGAEEKNLISNLDNQIVVWDISSGRSIETIKGEGDNTFEFTLNPDETKLAYTGLDGRIFVLDLIIGKVSREFKDNHQIVDSLAFSPNGTFLASSSGTVVLWNMKDVLKQDEISANATKYLDLEARIQWGSNNGKTLVFMPGSATIILRNTDTDQPLFKKSITYPASFESIAFSPNDLVLATGTSNGTIMLWDVETGNPILSLPGHEVAVIGVEFSQNGNLLTSYGKDSSIHVWELDPQSWITNICKQLGRNFTLYEWSQFFHNEPYHQTCPQWPVGG